jgi:1,2-diacylglycerol 3-beta-glucosyltransferase
VSLVNFGQHYSYKVVRRRTVDEVEATKSVPALGAGDGTEPVAQPATLRNGVIERRDARRRHRMEVVTVLVILIALYVYTLATVSTQAKTRRDRGSNELFFVLLVPALNEERVIGKTMASLLQLRGKFVVLIIDDASDDGTVAAVAPFLRDPRVQLLEQPPEQARRGKGHALNAAYAVVQGIGLAERYGPENVITVVFDADTRVEPDFLDTVAPYFRDPKVAGVQSAVRMYNATLNVLTLWQHLEFAIWAKFFCRAKDLLGSATLGGNGQCVRLAALRDFGDEPWHASSLTEDLDLSLRLLRKGWRLRFCSSIAVWQEAVPRLRALVRQRSRWLQGHVVCWQHLPALLRSRLPVFARLELLLFLLLPAVFMPIGLVSIFNWLILLFLKDWDDVNVVSLLIWYVLGFGIAPLVVAAWRPLDRPSLWRSLLHCHLFVFYSFVWFLAGAAVYWQVILGRRAWVKTDRLAEAALEEAQTGIVKIRGGRARRRTVDEVEAKKSVPTLGAGDGTEPVAQPATLGNEVN